MNDQGDVAGPLKYGHVNVDRAIGYPMYGNAYPVDRIVIFDPRGTVSHGINGPGLPQVATTAGQLIIPEVATVMAHGAVPRHRPV